MYQNLITRILIGVLALGVGTDSYLLWKRQAPPNIVKQADPAMMNTSVN